MTKPLEAMPALGLVDPFIPEKDRFSFIDLKCIDVNDDFRVSGKLMLHDQDGNSLGDFVLEGKIGCISLGEALRMTARTDRYGLSVALLEEKIKRVHGEEAIRKAALTGGFTVFWVKKYVPKVTSAVEKQGASATPNARTRRPKTKEPTQ